MIIHVGNLLQKFTAEHADFLVFQYKILIRYTGISIFYFFFYKKQNL